MHDYDQFFGDLDFHHADSGNCAVYPFLNVHTAGDGPEHAEDAVADRGDTGRLSGRYAADIGYGELLPDQRE